MARVAGAVGAAVLLLVATWLSITVGSRPVPLSTVLLALFGDPGATTDAAVVLDLRVPRTAVAIAAGAALGLSGGVIQAVTRNPLADPGVLGITPGSAFAVAVAVGFLGVDSASDYRWYAFGGALVVVIAVSLIGAIGRDGGSPARTTLAGVALGAVFIGITSSIVLADPRRFDAVRSWEAGALEGRGWDDLLPVLPLLAVGAVLALILTRSFNSLALGEDRAAALGVRVGLVRLLAAFAIAFLAGGATAVAGPLVFVGLMIPHVARWIAGPDQRWILPLCIVLGPSLLLVADVLGRVILPPGEIPVGIVTAALGAPALIALARRRAVIAP
ncbi:FecCD family ABC transporter permease [Naasia lichenicola]|uniref:FecCD family ABC transporter permease n=1 Tax=Naasia lichenicola TaxID=2565933 RepID=UPI001E3EE69B|nr:iron chelate uptake ABC transporter family permease subunit [Naasia lichenicola]